MNQSIYKLDIENELIVLCESLFSPDSFRVVDLDCRTGPRILIRLFVERVGAAQTSLEDCGEVSRLVGPALEEKMSGSFDLEVSSPGLDKRLRLVSDFEKAVGAEVKLALKESIPGVGANVRAKLFKVDSNQLHLILNGAEVSVALDKVKKANKVWVAV